MCKQKGEMMKYIVMITVLVITGCASTMVGRSRDELIEAKGTPSGQLTRDGTEYIEFDCYERYVVKDEVVTHEHIGCEGDKK